jgi:hypothetical protein
MLLSGCAGISFTGRPLNQGFIYAESSAGERVTQNAVGAKKGEACANSILGIVTTGDASIATAAKAGGINKIGTVNNKLTNILGVYATYCVEVTGD